jgi:6-phosphogluconate dehydrogenase
MKLAMIGLGRMGGNMARRLLRGGHQVVGYTLLTDKAMEIAAEDGLTPASSLEEAVQLLDPVRVVWLMLPSGSATEETIQRLAVLLTPGDVVIDGGNSNYLDTIRRASLLRERGIHMVDVGTSRGSGIGQGTA